MGNNYLFRGKSVNKLFTAPGTFEIKLGVTAVRDTIANLNADSVFIFCCTKTIVVLPASFKAYTTNKTSSFIQMGKDEIDKTRPYDLSKIKNPSFSIYLGSSSEKIDPEYLMVDNSEKVQVVYSDSLYRYIYGNEKNAKDLLPDYVKTKKTANSDAFVVVLSNDTIVQNQINSKKDFKINFDSASYNASLNILILDSAKYEDAVVIYFDFDSHKINKEHNDKIQSLVKNYKAGKYYGFFLMGFADDKSGTDYNLTLSQMRVAAVKNVLLTNSVDKKSVTSKWYGINLPGNKQKQQVKNKSKRFVVIIPQLK